MLNLTETAIRLYRQLFGSPEFAGQLADGIETVLDGNTAIAVTEACMTEVAALGGGFLEQGAALAWLSEQQRIANNLFDEKLSVQYADSPRGALASAIGVSLSGHRSTVFLSAHDLLSCQDLLQTAVGRRLPLVIHLDNRLSAMQANSTGSGHDTLHQVMDSGCFVLFAANVQEAVDFTLIARHVAEITLTPGVVVVDGIETALAAQNVCLPSAKLIKYFIGRIDEAIDSPSIAQKQLFSEQRNRVHRWHDLDKPVLQGAMQSPEIYSLGSAARETYFEDLVASTLESSFADFAQLTARQYSSISSFGLKKADVIFVAQGSAIETVRTFAAYLKSLKRKSLKINVGIIGLHSLRPFDSTQLINLLQNNKAGTQQLIILERMTVPLADDAPLMREIRAAIHKKTSADNITTNDFPALRSIIYGLGGVALKHEDLWALCEDLQDLSIHSKYLGVPFVSYDVKGAQSKTKECHPKRQVMLDTLERYYPQISELGINAKGQQLSLCSAATHSISFAISHMSDGRTDIAYAMDLSATLQKLKNGFLRTIISSSWEQWAVRQTDYITYADVPYTIGCSSLVDFFIVLTSDDKAVLNACQKLTNNGILIVSGNLKASVLSHCHQLIKDKNISIYQVKHSEESELSIGLQQWEKTLATLTGIMLNKNLLNIKLRKVISLRESLSHCSSDDNQETLNELFKETLNSIVENKEDSQLVLPLSTTDVAAYLYNGSSEVPEMVKKLGQASEAYDSLPRFWDQVGVLNQAGESNQLTADPYLATGTMPSLSATFNDMNHHRQTANDSDISLPLFNPKECDACGLCWSNCPDSAIAVVAITPKALIETGIKIAGADAVRQVTGKLASRIAKRCRNDEVEAANAGELLSDAFSWLQEKSGLPEERMQSIEVDFEKAHLAIADLPVVISDLLFNSPEKKQNDTGELFSLVINPDSCKGCGLCVELCDSVSKKALTHCEHESQSHNYQLKQQWKIWQQTPDTSSATIERLLQENTDHKIMAAGAALMLSRHNAFALSGGDHGELGSGEKIAMRQLLSAVEYHQQPLLHQFIMQLDRLRNDLKEEINHSLSAALPTDNLAHLAKKLSDVKTRQVDLNALLDDSSQVMDVSAIDAVKTHQLVKLVLQINELHWKISEGAYGLGRSRYSLCITSSSIASWAGTFPNNPFHVPVNIDVTGESVQVAAGLVQGQVNDLLSAVSLMRQARASIDSRYAKETDKLEHLDWHDLTDEEQHLCPPLFLVGGDDLLGAHGFSQISLLLNSDYPVKIIIFNELDAGLVADGLQEYKLKHRTDSRNNLAMMAMSQQNSYVAQTSFADSNHFQSSVQQLLNNVSAGLLCIHTPSPQRHGFAPQQTLKQAQLAVDTNMFPLFQYDPQNKGVFGSRITLHDSVLEEKTELNPAYWAMNEKRFQSHFTELAASSPSPVELSDWLNLSLNDQNKKTPYIILDHPEGEKTKISISHEFASIIIVQHNMRRTLLELAGIVTPFTDYVEQCIIERLGAEHQADLDALRLDYEAKLAQINANYQSETHVKIRNQLLGLAGYDVTNMREQ